MKKKSQIPIDGGNQNSVYFEHTMINLVMKPEKAPVVNREGLYSVRLNGEHFMHVRARNAAHAEKKLAYCFRRELSGKTLDFNLEACELRDNEGGSK